MKFSRLAALAATACAASATVLVIPPSTASASTPSCSVVPIFETDGYGNTETGANWATFNANVPTGYASVPVLYDDGVFPVKDQYTLDQAVADGVTKLTAAVTAYHAACPTSRMILAGYSEGAAVAGNVIENLAKSTSVPHNLIDGVLYGDPRRPFGPDGRAGGTAGGIETNIPTMIPGVTMQGPHNFGDIAVREVCNENDGICNSVNFITNQAAFWNGIAGYASGDHSYNLNPVANQGSGLIFNTQNPRIPYGASLPIPSPTPYQIQQQFPWLAPPSGATWAQFMQLLSAVMPGAVHSAATSTPWGQLATY